MSEKIKKEELLLKTKKPEEEALKLHPYYQGKIQIAPKCPIWVSTRLEYGTHPV